MDLQKFSIEAQMLLHSGPLIFLRKGRMHPAEADHNGTFGLIDTGIKKLLVTCWHVWDGFWDFRNKNAEARMALLLGEGMPVLMPDVYPLAFDRDLDLAIFDMEPLIDRCQSREFHRVRSFPIPRVRPNDIVAFLGYPGVAKSLSRHGAGFRYSSFGLSVTSVGDFGFVLYKEERGCKLVNDDGVPIEDFEICGISGSPCYKLSPNGVLSLVGFVKEGKTTNGSIFVAHASFVQSDGKLSSLCL